VAADTRLAATERAMSEGAGERLALVLLVGALLLNFPIFAIFNRATPVAGIPVFYLYLFGVWGAGILATWLLVRRR
jgi:hypothetical protein